MKAFIVVVNLGVQTALQNIFVMTGNGKLCGGEEKRFFNGPKKYATRICLVVTEIIWLIFNFSQSMNKDDATADTPLAHFLYAGKI